MKNLSLRFLLVIIASVWLFFSCQNQEATISTKKTNTLSTSILADSAFIVNGFMKLLALKDVEADQLQQELLATSTKDSNLTFIYEYNKLKYWMMVGRLDSAKTIVEQRIKIYDAQKEQSKLGYYYNLLGIAHLYKGEIKQGVAALEQGIRIFDAQNNVRQSGVLLQNIVNTFFSQHDYQAAYKYCLRSRALLKESKDGYHLPINAATCALCAGSIGKMEEAYKLLDEAESDTAKHPLAIILTAFASGELAMLEQKYESAILSFHQVLAYSDSFKIRNVVLPTYASLVRALIHTKETKEGIAMGWKAMDLATKTNNSEISYSLFKNLSHLYAQDQNYKLAYELMDSAEVLFRNSKVKNDQTEIQELLIQYEDEKKNNTILQQENELSRSRTIIIALGALALIGIILWLWRNSVIKSKQAWLQQEQEKEVMQALFEGEEKERQRLADEIHNGIASKLVAVKFQLEEVQDQLQPIPQIDKVLQIITDTHHETRQIAHNLSTYDFDKQSFVYALRQFCNSNASQQLAINFSSNIEHLAINKKSAFILYRCVQEFIQNAMKHARASRIDVQVLDRLHDIMISIEDDGVGFNIKDETIYQQGLYEAKRKLKQINVDLTIESTESVGTAIFLQILK